MNARHLFTAATVVALGLAVTACANDPLIFTSSNTIGIKIAVSPSETQPLKLNVGYDAIDSAIIPTSTDKARDQLLARSHWCITKDEPAKECIDFDPQNRPRTASSTSGAPAASPVLLPDQGGRVIRYDALSVLALFDSKAQGAAGAGANVGFGLGKTFATGIAAQNISDGLGGGSDARIRCLAALEHAMGTGKVDSATAQKVCGIPGS
jgi:hypothetical protein